MSSTIRKRPRRSGADGSHHVGETSADVPLVDVNVIESCGATQSRKGVGLLVGPAMAGKAGGAGLHLALDREEPPSGSEHATNLREALDHIRPVMHGRNRPCHRRRMVLQR